MYLWYSTLWFIPLKAFIQSCDHYYKIKFFIAWCTKAMFDSFLSGQPLIHLFYFIFYSSLQPYEIIAHNLPNTLTLSSSKSLLSSLRSPPVSIKDHLYHINVIGSLLATAVMYNDTLDCNLSVPLIKQVNRIIRY